MTDLHPSDCVVVVVRNFWNPTDLHVGFKTGPGEFMDRALNRPPVVFAADDAWEWAAYAARVLRRWHRMRAARDRADWLAGWGLSTT